MRLAERMLLLATLAAATLATDPAAALAASAVSPGEVDREVEIASGCPTYSWGAVDGASGYELAVFERDDAGEPELVLRREVAANATSWSPARADCLAAGGSFVWTVRATSRAQATAATTPAGEWSRPRRFRVPGRPSDEEVAAALEVLRRWRGDRGGSDEPDLPARSSPASRVGGGSPISAGASMGGGPAAAIRGSFSGVSGVGVSGLATPTSGPVTGVRGETASSQGYGVHGISTATTNGPTGVRGEISATNGAAVWGDSASTDGHGYGVRGDSHGTAGSGVYGVSHHGTSPYAYGVQGHSSGANGVGVQGGSSAESALGVWGTSGSSSSGVGVAASVAGTSAMGIDSYVYATTGQTTGIRSWVVSSSGRGIHSHMAATTGSPRGVVAVVSAPSGIAVLGDSGATSGTSYGVRGEVSSTQGRAIYGEAPNTSGAYAGYFSGRVQVTGTLSKGGGSFKIDHPLEPERKYLYHSFVESPDMMNVYNGNVVLDARGEAWVELPDWFEALNGDYRYQLTPVGEPSMVWVGRPVEENRFLVRGGAHVQVSWQVTGVRHDRWAQANRIPVEVEKPPAERGTYLHPEAWGVEVERGLDWRVDEPHRRAKAAAEAASADERERPAWADAHPMAPMAPVAPAVTAAEAARAPR